MKNWKLKFVNEITNNLDNKRVPLNESQRSKIRGNGTYPYFGANNELDRIDEYIFDEKILCVAEDGGSWGYKEKCSYIVEEKCWVNNHAHVLTAKSDVSLDYLRYWLNHSDLNKYITGTTRGKLTRGALNRIEIPLPPLPEQKRIAEVLDKADALREKRRLALQKLDTLLQSVFLEMFGKSDFPQVSIEELLKRKVLLLHKDGNHGGLYPRAEEFGNSGVPFLSAKCVTDDGLINYQLIEYLKTEKANKLKIGWIEKGDVLLAHNASVGKVTLYQGEFKKALIGTSLTAFRPNQKELTSSFLWGVFRSDLFQRQLEKNMGQTTRNQVPITTQRQLKIIMPPLELQNKFSAFLGNLLNLKRKKQKSLDELNKLFQSLQQKAFKGELFDSQ